MSAKITYTSFEMRTSPLKKEQEQSKSLIASVYFSDHEKEEKVEAEYTCTESKSNITTTFDSVAPIDIIKAATDAGYQKSRTGSSKQGT